MSALISSRVSLTAGVLGDSPISTVPPRTPRLRCWAGGPDLQHPVGCINGQGRR